jgi:tripartite-type tricarboxylate transporter receptor subunit TctC
MKRRRLLLAACSAIVASPPLATVAAGWPERPIRMILPFPAGSATDGATRLLMEEVRKSLGQPIVIENQAGADGIIAAQNARRAAPDGYTFFVSTNSAHGSNPALYKSLPYDPEKDFEPIAGLIRIPLTLCVATDFPADDVAGFVTVARQKAATKPLNYGSGNTSNRVAAELFRSATNIDLINVPYRGTPQALQDLVAGQIDLMFVDPYSAMGFIHGGKLKVLATLDSTRHPMLPSVPTLGEAGYRDSDVVTWAALFAPARTEPAIIYRFNAEINAALARPDTAEGIGKIAMTPMSMTPDQTRAFVRSEIVRWGRLVELSGIPKN